MAGQEVQLKITAHVFQIDPATRRSWVPIGDGSPIPIAFQHDTSSNTYHIVATDNGEAVVDSQLTSNMNFNKTSQKFGQWTDQRAGTVYGVGFQSEQNLAEFTESFEVGTNPPPLAQQPIPMSTAPPQAAPPVPDSSASNDTLTQLKYENERLKIALGTSSTNAKRWEQELQTLKNNNARLKTALQESAANVEEWKTQLTAWKEESTRMKNRVRELEALLAQGGASGGAEVQELQAKLKRAEAERDALQREVAGLKANSGPAQDAIVAQQGTIGRIEKNLQQQLLELAGVRTSLAKINLE
jgi:homer protein